jgi:hypothetical protein
MGENSIFQPMMGMTTDGGASWNFVPFYLNSNEGKGYDVIFTDIQRGYAACGVWDGRGAIARTTDGGATWNSILFSGPLYAINFPISATSLVGYAAGENGTVLKTTDAGNSWRAQIYGIGQRLDDISFLDFDYGFAVGSAGTILKTETGGEPPVGIINNGQSIPNRIKLLANYPNPFNPRTTISWQLSVNSNVSLNVYNLQGQKVKTLLSASQLAGFHSIELDASGMASGVYFYMLEAGAYFEIKKMIVLK